MQKFSKITYILTLLMLILSILTIITAISRDSAEDIAAGWGDNGGGRASYTKAEIDAGALGNKIIFNTISDSTIGDEKNFVGARIDDGDHGADNKWSGNEISAENGKEYLIRIYVHNNNPDGYDAVAEDTRVFFSIPNTAANTLTVNGFIDSSNAIPSEYWDSVSFVSDNLFHLEYIYGSALLENNGIGKDGGITLSDKIVTDKNGVLIGYDVLDGKIPGCYQYASYVSIKVRVVYDTDYAIEQKVRLAGTKEWIPDEINAEVGDKVEFQLQYLNTDPSGLVHRDVMVGATLPTSLKYVLGSTRLWNDAHDGDRIVQDTIITTGINIGHYASGANAFVRFTAEVVDEGLVDGSNVLVTWGNTTVNNMILQDSARVRVEKEIQ